MRVGGAPKLPGEALRRPAAARVAREHAIDGGAELVGEVGTRAGERRRARGDPPRRLDRRGGPEGMSRRQRLPEEDAHRPDVRRARRLLAVEALGRDVCERSRHVSRRRQRLRLVHPGEPEVEESHGDVLALLEHDVGRFHVAVHNAFRVCVAERLQHLHRGLDCGAIVDLAPPECLAERPPPDVLVRDVDVPVVPVERERAQTTGVAEAYGRFDLALGPCTRLALPSDDLERDDAGRSLVPHEPDGARSARAERPERPVAAEDEIVLADGDGLLHNGALCPSTSELLPPGVPAERAGRLDRLSASTPVFERENRDIEEIEFDFFDDSPTRETSPRAPSRRRRRVPARPPAGGRTALLRLAGLIAGAILLAVALVLWVNSCRQDEKAAYQDYMESVAGIGGRSQQIGRELARLVATPGKKLADLRQELDGLAQQQRQAVVRAQELDPPGPLREQHESLVEALQLRVSGLSGLSRAFSQIGRGSSARAGVNDLAEQSDRLVASDVVYDDFFKEGARDVLQQQEVLGVPIPNSNFVRGRVFSNPRSWALAVQRLTQSPRAGGLHGNQIQGVRVQPGGKLLSPTGENTVEVSDRLALEVLVKNSGESQEA